MKLSEKLGAEYDARNWGMVTGKSLAHMAGEARALEERVAELEGRGGSEQEPLTDEEFDFMTDADRLAHIRYLEKEVRREWASGYEECGTALDAANARVTQLEQKEADDAAKVVFALATARHERDAANARIAELESRQAHKMAMAHIAELQDKLEACATAAGHAVDVLYAALTRAEAAEAAEAKLARVRNVLDSSAADSDPIVEAALAALDGGGGDK